MKTLFATALCALCAAASQAVAIHWSEKQAVSATDTIDISSGGYTGSFSIAVVFTLDALPTQSVAQANNILTLTGNPVSVGMGTGFVSSGNVHYFPWGSMSATAGTTPTYWSQTGSGKRPAKVGNFIVGENIIGIVVRKAPDADNNYSLMIDFYANGVLLTGSSTGIKWSSGHDNDSFSTVTIGSLVPEGGEFYIAQGAAKATDFAALPEPTALALLALGVAGVALRRKAA